MTHKSIYKSLRHQSENIGEEPPIIDLNVKIIKKSFSSSYAHLLPGASSYSCKKHGETFLETYDFCETGNHPAVAINDYSISNNIVFPYYIMMRADSEKASDVIFLFHGLNEKNWNKYLPWAYELVRLTGKAVIMFPIAFHMERAPDIWSDFRQMKKVAKERASRLNNAESSFVNAAISERLQANPQRIFWSGFQTYMDFADLISSISDNDVEGIAEDAKIDFFGYSIGSIFTLILLMAGLNTRLDDSRLFIFCGGSTLDRMYPISKYIMDMKACIAIQNYYEEQLNNNFANEKRLGHYLSEMHHEQSYFKAILTYRHYRELRENRLKQIYKRIYAVALAKDEVVPPHEILNTLKGGFRDIDTRVDVMDFDFPYSHVSPFPFTDRYEGRVDDAFRLVLKKAGDFLI